MVARYGLDELYKPPADVTVLAKWVAYMYLDPSKTCKLSL